MFPAERVLDYVTLWDPARQDHRRSPTRSTTAGGQYQSPPDLGTREPRPGPYERC